MAANGESKSNRVYHNNFINNTNQTYLFKSFNNTWDGGYPSGGNYWNDNAHVDLYSGLYQNKNGSDGISDVFYDIDMNNKDRFALMATINAFNVGTWNGETSAIEIVSNSTVSDFQLDASQKMVGLNVSGDTGFGFCRVIIPNVIVQGLWQHNYTIFINGQPVEFRDWTNTVHTYTSYIPIYDKR